MTTLAYRAGVLCSDSASTHGTIRTGSVRKVAHGPQGSLVATCGGTLSCAAMLRWVERGMDEDDMPKLDDDDFSALLIKADGSVHWLGADGTQVAIDTPFAALGSGREIALGAMAAGADAEQAVLIACGLDVYSREPVQTFRLGDD